MASGPLLVGLFTGLCAWYARTVLKYWDRTPFMIVIGVSLAAAIVLLAAISPARIPPSLGGYALGLVLASALYVGLYRISERRWPTTVGPKPLRDSADR